MTLRELALVDLLERYDDLVSPLLQGGQGGSTGVMLMPETYTDSVRELERLLRLMRATNRRLWWHLNERFLACEWVTRDVWVRRKAKHGKHVTVVERRRERVRDGSVDALVTEGVVWLANAWGLGHEPMLPRLEMASV